MDNVWDWVIRLLRNDFDVIRTPLSCDAHEAVAVLKEQKILTYLRFRDSKELPEIVLHEYNLQREKNNAQNRKTAEFIQSLYEVNRDGIPDFVIIKGASVDWYLYDFDGRRMYNDIDLLIMESDACIFHHMLSDIGCYPQKGMSSAAAGTSGLSRAKLAANMTGHKRITETFPVKIHRPGIEFAPYYSDIYPTTELHYGIHFLKEAYTCKLLARSRHSNEYNLLPMPDVADLFVLLITAAYENSESIAANLFDNGYSLRDYADIKRFLDLHGNDDVICQIRSRIDEAELDVITRIVLNNLDELYGSRVSKVLYSDPIEERSRWKLQIADRMQNPELTRANAAKILRCEWMSESSAHPFTIGRGTITGDLLEVMSGVIMQMQISSDDMQIVWRIDRDVFIDQDLLYQCRLYPLGDNLDWYYYKIDLAYYDSELRSYIRKTDRISQGAVQKKSGSRLKMMTEETKDKQSVNVYINVPTVLLGEFDGNRICMEAEIFSRYYEESFIRYSKCSKSIKRLII